MRLISEEVEVALNNLLGRTFQANSHSDNVAYWLDVHNYVKAQDVFHHEYAHKFPEWADGISDLMIKMGCRPTRKALTADEVEYGDHGDAFTAVADFLLKYRSEILEVIELADMNDDREVVIFLEDYLSILTIYYKQVNIWREKALEIPDPARFDKYFGDNTIIA